MFNKKCESVKCARTTFTCMRYLVQRNPLQSKLSNCTGLDVINGRIARGKIGKLHNLEHVTTLQTICVVLSEKE